MTGPLVSTGWLEDHLGDPGIRIIEVSATEDGETSIGGHIPGAAWVFWKDFCWHATDREFATPAEMAERLSAIGVTPETNLVLCGDPVQYGTYAYWTLTMAGHRNLKLLDGALTKWALEERETLPETGLFERSRYIPGAADRSSRVGRDDVLAGLGRKSRLLLDVRSPEEYRGERVMPPPGFDHGAERKGRIPGAVHLHYLDLLNKDDTFKPPDQLQALFGTVGATPESPAEIIAYCRLSHRATLAWFAMTRILEFQIVRIYDGSWTEWGSIVGYPVEGSGNLKP